MPTFALIHNGIITRLMEAETNPFHGSLSSVNVTGIPAQLGNTVDAVGNVGPSPRVTGQEAAQRQRAMLDGEGAYQAVAGVWMPKGDPNGHLFGTAATDLAVLAALAAGKSSVTPAIDGTLPAVAAADVYAAACEYLAACYTRQAELTKAMQDDPETNITEGWPDNGEPSDKTPAPAPVAMSAEREPGTGIHPELPTEDVQNVDAPEVGGTVEAPVVTAP